MKLSILMPTFNDGESIIESLDSVRMQNNENWELIIINDGSTDNSEEIIKNYIQKYKLEKKIRYLYQENQDQLRAILNGSKHITGDYVMFLHSDDLLASNDVIDIIFKNFENNKDKDAFLSHLLIIDENSNITGMQEVKKYELLENSALEVLLFLGRNIYADTFVARKDFFAQKIADNYLIWNTPFWLTIKENINIEKVFNINEKITKYRVHSGNYINNEIGKLNVINGELRTAINLMKFYNIPLYKNQFLLYRTMNKLKRNYKIKYENKEFVKKADAIEFILDKRFCNKEWKNNLFLNSLYEFFNKNTKRTLKLDKIKKNEFIYLGCDMRKFNKNILNNNLSEFYINLINEMQKGFNKVVVKKGDKEKATDLFKFLCIEKFIVIEEEA